MGGGKGTEKTAAGGRGDGGRDTLRRYSGKWGKGFIMGIA